MSGLVWILGLKIFFSFWRVRFQLMIVQTSSWVIFWCSLKLLLLGFRKSINLTCLANPFSNGMRLRYDWERIWMINWQGPYIVPTKKNELSLAQNIFGNYKTWVGGCFLWVIFSLVIATKGACFFGFILCFDCSNLECLHF